MELKVIRGDITKQKVDAIVNAANTSLLGGGGVDGAIHMAAGAALLDECRKLGGCYTGDAKVTNGYRLPAKFIIHTVGPVWRGGKNNEEELLKSCYRKSLMLAEDMKLKSIAFPNISTGIYGYPKGKAAEVAVNEVNNTLPDLKSIKEIIFVCFDEENYDLYQKKIVEV
jgi:O-acetyl-ADP-ribose deacetylase (regulator of RNase III)